MPVADNKRPAIFLLHGGGGLEDDTGDIYREMARTFASRGYVVLIPHFFERTRHVVGQHSPEEFTTFIEVVRDAIEYAVRSGVVDPDRIGVVGYSLSTHIAFYRAARDPRIKAIVSCAGDLPVESDSKFPPILILQGREIVRAPQKGQGIRGEVEGKRNPF